MNTAIPILVALAISAMGCSHLRPGRAIDKLRAKAQSDLDDFEQRASAPFKER